MSSIYKKLADKKHTLDCISNYLRCLRRIKRGEIKEVPEPYNIFDNDRVLMDKLIHDNLLDKIYLCVECHQIFESVEDYYNYLPWINISKGNGIILICNGDKCLESSIRKRIIKLENKSKNGIEAD